MTNEIGSYMCPLNCPCQGDHGSDLGPLLAVVAILIAAHFARKWWKGKTSMKNLVRVAVVLALAAVMAVVVAIKQNKTTAQEKAPPPAVVSSAQPLPRLVDLGARKCIPCKMMAPILDELKKTYATQLAVEFIDVSENPMAGRQYGIDGIPTQIFISADGRELFRHWGFFSKEDILAKWKELGVELTQAADAAP